MPYIYYDWNEDTTDPDISSERYGALLENCFRLAETFSLDWGEPDCTLHPPLPEPVRARRLSPRHFLCRRGPNPGDPPIEEEIVLTRRYYACTPEAMAVLRSFSDSFFGWSMLAHRPDNLMFHRADGSMLLWSLTHEGECVLRERPGEDVRSILAIPGWQPLDPVKAAHFNDI